MKKIWLFLAAGLAILLVGGGFVVRSLAKSFVESDEFQRGFTEVLERGAGSVIPNPMVQVKEIRLVGLATLEIKGIEIRNAKKIENRIAAPTVRATPGLWSLLGPGPVPLLVVGDLEGKGSFEARAKVPKNLITEEEKPGHKIETVEAEGRFDRVDAVGASGLFFADAPSSPNFRLTRGYLGGTFTFKKPFGGHASDGRKSGDVHAKLEGAEWALAVGPVKKLAPPTFDIHVEVKDYSLELRAPVVMEDKKAGRALISGSLLLPERADRMLAWDLDVKTEGVIVHGSLAKLFKCKQIPPSPHFTVRGPIAATTCAATK